MIDEEMNGSYSDSNESVSVSEAVSQMMTPSKIVHGLTLRGSVHGSIKTSRRGTQEIKRIPYMTSPARK